jgi:hypothetical protein
MCDKYEGLVTKSSKGLESDHAAAPGKGLCYTEQNADWTASQCGRCREETNLFLAHININRTQLLQLAPHSICH